MLTPRKVDKYADRAAAAFDELEDNILRDMARRIANANYMTDTARWQAERAKALGASTRYLYQQMQALRDSSAAQQAARIFAEALLDSDGTDQADAAQVGAVCTPLGSSPAAQQLAQSGLRRTLNTLYNLTQTRALMGNKNLPYTQQAQLARILDAAHFQVASGAFSYTQAISHAVRTLADEGLGAITYPSGHVDRLETVVRRAVLTGINQTAVEITLYNAQQLGVDTLELSAHGGARTGDGGPNHTNHSWWQGKLVSLSGRPGYLSLADIGYGDVRGFCGANCRHNWHLFWEGVSQPAYTEEMLADYNAPKFRYNGELLTEEECDKKQRALERQIRAKKRRYILAREAGLTEDEQAAARALAGSRAKLKDFLHQTGRLQQPEREQVPGFGHSEASRATAAARRAALTAAPEHGTLMVGGVSRGSAPGSGAAPLPDVTARGHIDLSAANAAAAWETEVQRFLQEFLDPNNPESKNEHMLLITATGDVYHITSHYARGISTDGYEHLLPGSYNIHTHPEQQTQFTFSSEPDVREMLRDGTAVMEAADYKYRYRFTRPVGLTWEAWAAAYYEVEQQAMQILTDEGYTIDDNLDETLTHYTFMETCKRLGIENCYERWEL